VPDKRKSLQRSNFPFSGLLDDLVGAAEQRDRDALENAARIGAPGGR